MNGQKQSNNDPDYNTKNRLKALNELALNNFALSSSTRRQESNKKDKQSIDLCKEKLIPTERKVLKYTKVPGCPSGRNNSNNTSEYHEELSMPMPKKRNQNRNAKLTKSLTTQMSNSSSCSNDLKKSINCINQTLVKAPSSSSSYNQLVDQVNELRNYNTSLENHLIIINEKRKLLQEQLRLKTKENEFNQLKNEQVITSLKEEISKSKKINVSLHPMTSIKKPASVLPLPNNTKAIGTNNGKDLSNNQGNNNEIQKIISILMEICELYFTRKSLSYFNGETLGKVKNVSDNHNGNDKVTSLDNIKEILISNMKLFKKSNNMALDKEMDKIQNWKYTPPLSKASLSQDNQKLSNEELFSFHIPKVNLQSIWNGNDNDILNGNFQSPTFRSIESQKQSKVNISKTHNIHKYPSEANTNTKGNNNKGKLKINNGQLSSEALLSEFKNGTFGNLHEKKYQNDYSIYYNRNGNDHINKSNTSEYSIKDVSAANDDNQINYNGSIDNFTLEA